MKLKFIVYMLVVSFTMATAPFSFNQNKAEAALWSQNILANGGFESAPHGNGWSQFRGDPMNACSTDCVINSNKTAHTGDHIVRLGGRDSAFDVIVAPSLTSSGIDLPDSAVQIKLNYYYRLTSSDTTTNDTVAVAIIDPVSGPLTSKLYHSNTDNTSTWKLGSINLTAYKLNKIIFYFLLQSDVTASTPTTFDVDDVSLVVTYNDIVKPTGSVKINNNRKSTKLAKKVTLKIKATDTLSGVSKMRISNNNKKWTSWINYSTSYKNWNLTRKKYGGNSKQGKKRVYIQFKDAAGNTSIAYTDTIIYKK